MNTRTIDPTAPNATFDYQGAYLSLVNVELQLGPFSLSTQPGSGYGHTVGNDVVDNVPVTTLRPGSLTPRGDSDPEDSTVLMGYRQGDVPWQMAFSIVTDPKGGLVGTAFALDVESNFPSIPMSIAKNTISQPKFSVLKAGRLPVGYLASLKLRFWSNGIKDLPLDAWLAVQIGYYKDDAQSKNLESIPLVTTHELLYYPTQGTPASTVLGNNHPRPDRHRNPASASR